MENTDPKWHRIQVIASLVVALFAMATFYVGWQQYHLITLNERPWIGPTQRFLVIDNDKVLEVRWLFSNGGRAPAANIRYELRLKIGDPIPQVFTEQSKIPEIPECHHETPLPGSSGSIVIPNTPQAIVVTAGQDVIDSTESINKNILGLYLVGCVDYEDRFGKNYRLWVCEFYGPKSKELALCPNGNRTR